MESNSVCYHKSDDKCVYHEYDYRPNWTTQSLIYLLINRKYYNFREKKNRQVMKKAKFSIKLPTKEM